MTETARHTVPVALGPDSYDIDIGTGLLAGAGARLAPLLARPRTLIVTDETVAALHLATLAGSLDAAGIAHETMILPAGEATKTLANIEAVCARLAAWGVERRDTIIAFGGGVIGDLTGFAAAVMLRGIRFIQIPTTLLAQVDSSVGGKTGVNLPSGKNLVGAFHQPRLVLADIGLLASLSDREFRAGYAEVVKYGALGDLAFFDWLDDQSAALAARDPAALTEAVARSCAAKADIVAQDEREAGVRALLNLGHTFAHAFEAGAGYDGRVLHGEAVSVGMVLAFRLSVRLGLCPPGDLERLTAHLTAAGLAVTPAQLGMTFTVPALIDAMGRDKKVADGRVTFILARGIGAAFVARDVDMTAVADMLGEAGVTHAGASLSTGVS